MTVPVFVSSPTALTTAQTSFYDSLADTLRREGFEPRSVGRTDFGNSVPLITIRRLMSSCFGALILGFAQLRVDSGISRPATPRETQVRGISLATPWNHLEAGMAFQAGLPLMVIREAAVTDDGIFGLGVSDRFVHHADLSPEWLLSSSFTQPFAEWCDEVRAQTRLPSPRTI
jgi:hypothetical protein